MRLILAKFFQYSIDCWIRWIKLVCDSKIFIFLWWSYFNHRLLNFCLLFGLWSYYRLLSYNWLYWLSYYWFNWLFHNFRLWLNRLSLVNLHLSWHQLRSWVKNYIVVCWLLMHELDWLDILIRTKYYLRLMISNVMITCKWYLPLFIDYVWVNIPAWNIFWLAEAHSNPRDWTIHFFRDYINLFISWDEYTWKLSCIIETLVGVSDEWLWFA